MSNYGHIVYNQNKVSCSYYGSGKNLMIALHGFGQHSKYYKVLADALGDGYTICAIDLPLHGQTVWYDECFSKSDISQIINIVCKDFEVETFSVMGHSLGGRIWLSMLPELADRLDHVWLLAPDGLRGFTWTYLPIYIKKRIGNYGKKHYMRVLNLAKILNRLYLLPTLSFRFLAINLNTPRRRARLLGVWYALNDFKINRRLTEEAITQYNLPIYLFWGVHDRIIKPVTNGWFNRLSQVQTHLIDDGHALVNEKLAHYLIEKKQEIGIRY